MTPKAGRDHHFPSGGKKESMNIEDIQQLAKLEREMSEGAQPYVVNQGQRYAFSAEIMARCGLESGQEVSDGLMIAIMETNLAMLRERADAHEWPEEIATSPPKASPPGI